MHFALSSLSLPCAFAFYNMVFSLWEFKQFFGNLTCLWNCVNISVWIVSALVTKLPRFWVVSSKLVLPINLVRFTVWFCRAWGIWTSFGRNTCNCQYEWAVGFLSSHQKMKMCCHLVDERVVCAPRYLTCHHYVPSGWLYIFCLYWWPLLVQPYKWFFYLKFKTNPNII